MLEYKTYVDSRAVEVQTITVGDSTIRSLSCDHIPDRMPSKSPWGQIEEEIAKSSLVFLEYSPTELDSTVYNSYLYGRRAREHGYASGINSFFGRTETISSKHRKDIAVADIANKGWYELMYLSSRIVPIVGMLASTVGVFLENVEDPNACRVLLEGAAMIAGLYNTFLFGAETTQRGLFSPIPSKWDQFLLDLEDARRVYTARALLQTAQAEPGSDLLYIAPHAHARRVARYVQKPDSVAFRLKSFGYQIFPGLDRSIRRYSYNRNSYYWEKVSSEPIKA